MTEGGKMAKDSKEKFKEYYKKSEVAKTYDSQREGTKYRREKREKELRIFLDLLNGKGGNILELGCSSGALTKFLTGFGVVTAIDTNPEMLKLTKQKNPQAQCICADMFKLPFQDKIFNSVVTIRVWTHLNEKELREAIRESRRVLKDGGILVFDSEEYNPLRIIINFFYKRIFRITGYKIYRYKVEQLKKILEEEGFVIEQIQFLKHRIGRQIILRAKKL